MATVANFLDLHDPSNKWVRKVSRTPQFREFKDTLREKLKGRRLPPAFYELLIRELTEPLGEEVGDVMVGAWRKHREIQEYRDREKYPNNAGYVVILVDHSVASKRTVTITPMVGNWKLSKLEFDLQLKLNLKGVCLKIRDANIEQIRAGSFTGSGAIQYNRVTIVERKTRKVSLPLAKDFDPPIPI